MTDHIALGPGHEFDAIRELLARWGSRASGAGDDAAVVQVPRGDVLVASVDSSIEGRHFRRGWMTPREIGYRAAAAALSDLAAMAARPIGILIAATVPGAWRADLLDIADGIADAVGIVDTRILGGNLSDGGELSITTTVFGSAYAPLTRAGAQVGDAVYVTGTLGGSGAELRALLAGASHSAHRERFVRPVPRISEARWLADRGASSGIDISDGLVADARHLASASGVRLALDASCLPCSAGVTAAEALRSGEEYELLVTTASPFDVDEFQARFGLPLTRIGDVERGAAGRVDIAGDGDARGAGAAGPAGFNHFSE